MCSQETLHCPEGKTLTMMLHVFQHGNAPSYGWVCVPECLTGCVCLCDAFRSLSRLGNMGSQSAGGERQRGHAAGWWLARSASGNDHLLRQLLQREYLSFMIYFFLFLWSFLLDNDYKLKHSQSYFSTRFWFCRDPTSGTFSPRVLNAARSISSLQSVWSQKFKLAQTESEPDNRS